MTVGRNSVERWSSWAIEIKVWKLLAALSVVAVLSMWFRIVHQHDEILALIRNDVLTDAAGQRTWVGSFVNTNENPLRDVAVKVDLLDHQNRTLETAAAEANELLFGMRLDLQAPLPAEAVRLRIYSVQWRMGGTAELMGPFREAWEFGYLMADPAQIDR